MDLGLEKKVAIVAASSKGLGKAIAFRLGEEGAQLTIFARGKSDLENTAKEIELIDRLITATIKKGDFISKKELFKDLK